MKKKRLDDILLERGNVETKQEAFILVTEGRVLANGQKTVSPAQIFALDARIEVKTDSGYVGRGAFKLEGAMQHFGVSTEGMICADIGAATGGFTEILLKYGAAKVYAIDTAQGKLALKIRQNPKVVVMERTDVRHLESLLEKISLAVIDVSLISLKEILLATARLLEDHGQVIALLKPQYETRDAALLRNGIIEDAVARESIRDDMLEWAEKNSWQVLSWMESPIKGSEGNVEYLLHLTKNLESGI